MEQDKNTNLDEKQQRLELLRERVNAAKIAYLNRTPFENKPELLYEDLKKIAQEFIRASESFQKEKYGEVKVRISVAKLLRR